MPVCARQGHRRDGPALLRGAGTTLKRAKTGAIEGSESLSSASSGTTYDRLFAQCNACASRDQRTHQTDEDRCFTGVDMSRRVRDSRTKPSTVQVVVVHIHLD